MRTIAAAFLLFASVAWAEDIALVGGTVCPSPDARPLENATVLIRDGRIVQIADAAGLPLEAGVRRIDCTGRWLVAGFWNSHVHVFTPELLREADKPAALLQEQLDRMFNRWGFTHVFDLASSLENTVALRRRIESGELRGPSILTVGDPLWTRTPVYVREYLRRQGIEVQEIKDPAEAVARVSKAADGGANGIKLFTGSMQEAPSVDNMPLELARAAAEAAHARGLPVFAHPQNEAGLEVAIEAGVDVLAHTVAESPVWTPALVERLRRARMALIPSLTLFVVEADRAKLPPPIAENWINLLIDQTRSYAAAGGEILFGTDIGYIEEYDTRREFELMARAGMDFGQILASLTTAPAARFGRGESGRLEPGAPAHIVVLKADPRTTVEALAQVQLTLRAGHIIYQEP